MGRTMKEQKVLYGRLNNESKNFDEELLKVLEQDAIDFLREGCRISKHAYQMHADVNNQNIGHSDVVSYFYGGMEGLTSRVITIVKNSKAGIMNFLAARGYEDLEITRTFKKAIGVVYVDDDAVETNVCKIILSRDYYTGKLYTKTAYPVLA